VEKAPYRLVFGKLVVKRHCIFCRQHVRGNLSFLQKIERLAWDLKAFGHSTRKHDHFCAVLQHFLHIGNLNARLMTSPRLAPVPISRATGEKLRIFVGLSLAVDFKSTPGNVFDPRRRVCAFHNIRFAGDELRSCLLPQIPRRRNHNGAPLALQEEQCSQARAADVVEQMFVPVRLDQLGNYNRDEAVFVFLFFFLHEF
jgi:hypothetical protein